MDSQHRHELQQNDLRKLTTKAAPFVEQYAWHLVGAAVAALAVFFGLAYWFSETSAAMSEGWAQFDRVLHEPNADAGDYAELAEQYPGSTVAAWARLKEADDFLKSGLKEAFTNREVSQSELKKGLEAYQPLGAGGPGVSPEIRERALFGLARCQEAMSDGKSDDAVATYQRLLKEFPETIFQSIASERIKELETPQAKDFYAWFHELKPQPKDPHTFPFKKPEGKSDSADDAMEDEAAAINDSDEKPADATSVESSESPEPEKPKSETPELEGEPKPAEGEENTDSP